MFKKALVSVSDKTGLVEFLQPLVEKGLEIVSTGGTSDFLKKNKIPVIDISELTGFPEVMDGRVKTLHPHVHMGLLAREGHAEDQKTLSRFNVGMFDLVVCNLYPFEKSLQSQLSEKEMIEKIDVGGPTMLRAAAKNFSRITVVCDPLDYSEILSSEVDLTQRKKLAAKVFYHTSIYDSLIAKYLNPENENDYIFSGRLQQKMRYGENPDQKAFWYQDVNSKNGFHKFEILQGKELSYNNLLDLDAAWSLVLEFQDSAMIAVKHNNPCGAVIANQAMKKIIDSNKSTESSLSLLLEQLLKTDPVSIFGGIIAINTPVDLGLADKLSGLFLECVIAPDYSEEALKKFSEKKNLRIITTHKNLSKNEQKNFKSIFGGLLVQTQDTFNTQSVDWKVFGKIPNDKIKDDILFGEKVCGFLKSNSIALIDNGKTIGLGMGQVNRVDAVEQAIGRALKFHNITAETVLVSDAFFPFKDSIDLIAKHNIKWVFQPGGSVKDNEVIERAKELDINLIFSGKRHFRH